MTQEDDYKIALHYNRCPKSLLGYLLERADEIEAVAVVVQRKDQTLCFWSDQKGNDLIYSTQFLAHSAKSSTFENHDEVYEGFNDFDCNA